MKKRKGSASEFTLGKKSKKPEKLFIGKRLFNTFLIIFAAIVLGYGFITFCFQTVYMTGPSMESTISNNDELVMNKLAYKFGKIKRNDIVAIKKIGSDDYYDIKEL